jgi:hypothetical protein
VANDAQWELQAWAKRAERVAPLLRSEEVVNLERELDSKPDIARTTFFRANAHWTAGPKRAIRHAVSFFRRYSESGDYEVAGQALNVLLAINSVYVHAKGKTFYAANAFVENPFASDEFLSDTLEHLRQLARSSVLRADEQQIELTLRALAGLAHIYLEIDYSSPLSTKSHAQLAAGYLSDAVKGVIPANMPNVLMEGVSLMGRTAQGFLVKGQPNEITALAEQLALIGCTGVAKENYRPVTLAAMTQLANLTFDLLRTKRHNVRFAIRQVQENVSLLANYFLTLPDNPISSSHSTYLAPYYSSTSQEALRAGLAALVNALMEAKAGDENAKTVIRNITEWADKLHDSEKKLLLAAIKAKSQFTFDMLHWITGVTELLLAMANIPACDKRSRDKLRAQARSLVAVLSWIPDDKEAVGFLETFRPAELLFEAASDARSRQADEVANRIFDMLLSWTFRAGVHHTGWGTLEHGLRAAAVLAVLEGGAWLTMLRAGVTQRLASPGAPEQEARDSAARDLRENAESLYKREFPTSPLEAAANQSDHKVLRPLLREIADLLSPGTANDPIRIHGL